MLSPHETQSGSSLSSATMRSVKRRALLVTMPHAILRRRSSAISSAMPGKSRVSAQMRSA